MNETQVGFLLLIIGVVLFIYLFPSFIANRRKHRNLIAILVINLFLGWTFLFWVLALAWAVIDDSPHMVVIKHER